MPLKSAALVLVEWVDSCAAHGWHDPDIFDEWEPSKCVSVGWLLKETAGAILLAPHVSNIDRRDEKVDGVLMIPKVAITARSVLSSPTLLAEMSMEPDEIDYDESEDHDDGFECGAWFNGKFDFYSCQLAGTEDCDWECPHSASVRGLRK